MSFVGIFFLPINSEHPAVGTPTTTSKTATFDLQQLLNMLNTYKYVTTSYFY